ncbi:hypothetical protein GCM10020258_42220 [Sphingomonas yabuuchiae]
MSRIADSFAACADAGRAALVTFVTAGDPTPGDTAAILDALVEGGADVVELGMPFTDPMADGPAIQKANIRSLGAGTRTADVLAIATAFRVRHPHVPLVLMGYANPMTVRGPEWFAEAAAQAGVDGVICVDVPAEEDDALGVALRGKDRLDPTGDPDQRRRTPADDFDGCRRFPLLCLRRGYYRAAAGGAILDRRCGRPSEGRDPFAGRGRLRRPYPGTGGGNRSRGGRCRRRLGDRRPGGRAWGERPAPVRAYIQTLSSALADARKELA